MAYIKQLKVIEMTYGSFAANLLTTILSVGKDEPRIDVVFDVYRLQSIKNIYRNRRACGNLSFKQILPIAEIKQWNLFLSSNENKNALIKFIHDQWHLESNIAKIGQKIVYVTVEHKASKLTNQTSCEETSLECAHEEADTRMLFHANQASSSFEKIIISLPDTDVFIIAISKSRIINANLYMLTGTKNKRRIVNVSEVKEKWCEESLPETCTGKKFLDSLIGFHCFTGCDTVSAFAGKRKIRPFKVMINSEEYIDLFSRVGMTEFINEEMHEKIKRFVCHIYSKKSKSCLNELRYQIYCQRGGKIPCELLLPCEDVLRLHTI